MKLVKGKVYEIDWLDTFGYSGWYDEEDLSEKAKSMTMFQRSVGMFAWGNKDWVVLALTTNPNRDFRRWGAPTWIPKKVIKSIKRL